MGRPVFFSVASKDIRAAEDVAVRFPGDVIYLYTRTGVDGVEFWNEIELAELNQSRGLAIFWSRNFVKSESCRKELEIATGLLARGQLRHVAIIRVDDMPLEAGHGVWDEGVAFCFRQLAIFLARFRAASLPYDAERSFHMIDRLIREVTAIATPVFPRPFAVEQLRAGARASDFTYRPAVWVSGLNGYGRRTTIREFYRSLNGNATSVEFDVTEISLPLPLLLMIEERVFHADQERLKQIHEELRDSSIEIVSLRLARLIQSCTDQQCYIILRQTRVHEERAIPPEWIVEVIKALEFNKAPILFLTVQVPPPDELVIASQNKLGTVRMAALSLIEAEEFVKATITSLGNTKLDWDGDIISRISQGAHGNPELISKIVVLASTLPSLEKLDEVIGSETAEFATTMTRLARWAFNQIENEDERRALLVLDDLVLASADDIAAFLQTERPMANVLGTLERLGLVERDVADLYRLSPMLSNRLNASLVTPELTRWRDAAVKAFVSSPVEIDAASHGMVSIQARISAAMLTGNEVPESARQFVTAANYLQSGIRAYRANRMQIAHKLLGEAFARRSAFSDTARREVARFFGLVCARQGDNEGITDALGVLDSHYLSKPVAHFVRGFRQDFEKNFSEAADNYEKSRKADEDLKQTVREGLTIRYLVSCLLRMRHPNFERVIKLADRAVNLNSNAFVLTMRARAYLHRQFKSDARDQDEADSWWEEYLDSLEQLERHPGADDFYFQVRAEEAMLDPDQGPGEAISWMRQALQKSERFDHQLRLWQYMARSGETQDRLQMMKDIEEFAKSENSASISQSEKHKMIDYYARGLSFSGAFKKYQLDQVFITESEGYNFRAHSQFGKNTAPPTFYGDDVSWD